MNRIHSHLDEVNWIAKLADIKEDHYQHTLVLGAIVELLIEKKVITREELAKKAEQLDTSILDTNHPKL